MRHSKLLGPSAPNNSSTIQLPDLQLVAARERVWSYSSPTGGDLYALRASEADQPASYFERAASLLLSAFAT